MGRTVPFLQAVISFIVFMITIIVIGYIVGIFALGIFGIAQVAQSLFSLAPDAQQATITVIETSFFHMAGVIIILLQLARIFTHYLRTQEVGVLRVIELGIVGGLFEMLFDTKQYPIDTQYVLTALIIVWSGFYLYIRFVRGVTEMTTLAAIAPEPVPAAAVEVAVTEAAPIVPEAKPRRAAKRAAVAKKATRTAETKKAKKSTTRTKKATASK